MALSTDINKISQQAAGSYLLEYDNSQIPQVAVVNGIRLLIGQSKSGPVNKAIFINTYTQFKSIFGTRDRSLEHKGNYFHVFADLMLDSGGILALNIRKFDDLVDLTQQIELATSFAKSNKAIKTIPYRNVFNTDKFWYIQPSEIVDVLNTNQLLNIVNVGSFKKSIFIRKSKNSGFNQTIEQYYGTLGEPVPAYLDPKMNMNDTFIDVFVFNKDFSDLATVSKNPSYGYLFDANGLKKTVVNSLGVEVDAFQQLANISDSNYITAFSGSLIPSLSQNGVPLSIEFAINQLVDNVGLVCKINEDILYNAEAWEATLDINENIVYASNGGKKTLPIDILGHGIYDIAADLTLDKTAVDAKVIDVLGYKYNVKRVVNDIDKAIDGAFNTNYSGLYDGVAHIDTTANVYEYQNMEFRRTRTETLDTLSYVYSIADTHKCLYSGANQHKVGDKFVGRSGNLSTITKIEFIKKAKKILALHTSHLPLQADGTVFPQDVNEVFIYPVGHTNAGVAVEFDAITDAPLDDVGGSIIPLPTLTSVQLEAIRTSHGTERNVFEYTFDNELLIEGNQSNTVLKTADQPTDKLVFTDSTELLIYKNSNTMYSHIEPETFINSYTPIVLNSYKQRVTQFVNGTVSRQAEILSTLTSDLLPALKDREYVTFNYIVDAFKSYIQPNCKGEFFNVASTRQITTYIGSMPSMKEFKKSVNPYFSDTIGGKLNYKYIAEGGNSQLPSTQTFSLSGISPDYGAMFGTDVNYNDSGRDLFIPCSGVVSNEFVKKVGFGDIVAGEKGTITSTKIKGFEQSLDKDVRDILEPFGYNPIISKGGVFQIYGNQTAQQGVKSALSKLHVRELLNNIESRINSILQGFEFEYNTPQNRLIIETGATSICQNASDSGYIQSFKVQMNANNNTGEIIENSLGILDTTIIPGFGMEKLIHRMYINSATRTVSSEII